MSWLLILGDRVSIAVALSRGERATGDAPETRGHHGSDVTVRTAPFPRFYAVKDIFWINPERHSGQRRKTVKVFIITSAINADTYSVV